MVSLCWLMTRVSWPQWEDESGVHWIPVLSQTMGSVQLQAHRRSNVFHLIHAYSSTISGRQTEKQKRHKSITKSNSSFLISVTNQSSSHASHFLSSHLFRFVLLFSISYICVTWENYPRHVISNIFGCDRS